MAKRTKKVDEPRIEYIKSVLERFSDTPTKTLARKVYGEHPEWFTDLETARAAIRYQRGNMGAMHRARLGDKSNVRPNGDQTKPLSMPPSLAEDWTPHEIAGVKKLLVMSDTHVPYHSEKAIEVAVKHGVEQGCDGVLLNGDVGDFYNVSRYERDPRKRDLKGEIESIGQFLDWLRNQFPKKPIIYKLGNHDERWTKWIWQKAPELWDMPFAMLENVLEFEKRKIVGVSDQRPIIFSELPIFHGHELPRGLTNPVNMARGAFLRTVHTMLCGHGHRTSQHTETDLWHKEITCWSTGCLCDLRPEYARVNKWNWGFAIVTRTKDGFHVDNFRISQAGNVW